MTTPEAEVRSERKQIEAAIERLLAGAPLRSNGDLTVIQLALEADVKRWKLTHREQLEKTNRELREEIEVLRATVSC
ncbi:hypothetical protein DER29_6009 [Micromonospora sp. M71_S20]|nr:hypothetical protein DER29_6009 [Micromonospora sp. M71_S20]